MNETKQPTQTRADGVTQTAFWGTIALATTSLLICSYFFSVLFQQTRTPINVGALAVFLLAIVMAVTGIVLTISHRQELGVKILFFTFYLIGFSAVTLFQGRTFSASVSILLFSIMVIRWLFPSHAPRRWYYAFAIAAFMLMWVIEWINPVWRTPVKAATVGPVAVIGFALVLGWIVFTQSRRYLAASIATSLRLQITVWTGTIIAVVAAITIGYSVITSRQVAIDIAQEEAGFIALAQAENVKIQLDPALDTARIMSHTLGSVKDPENPISLTREQVNGILRKVAEENQSFLGTWTLWEPNAFDGLDAKYANTPIHDETGRFIPYWVRSDANTVEGVAIVDYETPGLNDWYNIPRETLQETVTLPYLYPINGVDVLMTTISVPIVENGKFYGATGVDYRVDFLQGIVDGIDLYNGTANAVLVTNDGTLVAVRNQPELTLQPASALLDDFAEIQSKLGSAETLVSVSPDGQFLRVFAPVQIVSGADWSFGLIIPFSEITAQATAIAIRETLISLVITILALLLLWYFTGQIVRPILDLTTVANAVSSGNLNAFAKVEATNEIGILATAFNSMTSQLRETLTSLEQRVADRTRNLELAAEVGRSVSQVRALDVMLKDAAELIRSQFDLYYVQVYLTDPSQTNLLLLSGTGQVGEQLVGRSHRLPLNTNSINGRAATEKKSVIIADTTASATFRPNPLLPDTRSEMAIPLIVGDKVVGVLDLQSEKANALTRELLPAFEALAGQVAIAIQNANLLAETEQARAEVEAQARRLVRANWADYQDAIHKPEETGFVFEQNKISALKQQDEANKENSLVAPISVTGETLGNLVVEMPEQSQGIRTTELVNTIAAQVAQHIESLRLLESAERYRAEAEAVSRRITREGWNTYKTNTDESLSYFYDLKEVRPFVGNGHDESALSVPLKVRDEILGKLAIQGLDANDSQALELANAVAERLSAHIESLRQFDETRRGQIELDKRAQQLSAVAEISTVSSKELDIDKMLASVVFLTQRKFGLYHAHVFTYNEITEELKISACGWKEGDEHEGTHGTTVIPIAQEQSLVARAARTKQPVIVNDVRNEPGWLPNPLLPDTASELAVPLLIGDQILGVLDVQSDRLNAFTEEDANIQTTLASQVATALQNARSFARAQQQANRESTLNVISQKIQSATSVEAVLQIAARELGHALGAPMTVAQLSMKDKS